MNYLQDLQNRAVRVMEGYETGLKLLAEIKKLEAELELLKAEIMPVCLNEIEKCITPQIRSFENYGASFSLSAGGRYDYSNYATHKEYQERLKNIENKMQAAYKSNATIIDDETGEVIPAAEYKANKPSITIKFSK
jgi:hypothetical protein